ncbi:MAG: metallophosphoesterase [Actinomycetota bacterium]|nr:metallophosphoesterase [Actinomycetota bacterium]
MTQQAPSPDVEKHGPDRFPDRIATTIAGDPATSRAVSWRTDDSIAVGEAQIAVATGWTEFEDDAETVVAATTPLMTNLDYVNHQHSAWTVAFFHHPTFSTAAQKGAGQPEIRELWLPLFEEYGVDLVLSGHDHSYGRGHVDESKHRFDGFEIRDTGTRATASSSWTRTTPRGPDVDSTTRADIDRLDPGADPLDGDPIHRCSIARPVRWPTSALLP